MHDGFGVSTQVGEMFELARSCGSGFGFVFISVLHDSLFFRLGVQGLCEHFHEVVASQCELFFYLLLFFSFTRGLRSYHAGFPTLLTCFLISKLSKHHRDRHHHLLRAPGCF